MVDHTLDDMLLTSSPYLVTLSYGLTLYVFVVLRKFSIALLHMRTTKKMFLCDYTTRKVLLLFPISGSRAFQLPFFFSNKIGSALTVLWIVIYGDKMY